MVGRSPVGRSPVARGTVSPSRCTFAASGCGVGGPYLGRAHRGCTRPQGGLCRLHVRPVHLKASIIPAEYARCEFHHRSLSLCEEAIAARHPLGVGFACFVAPSSGRARLAMASARRSPRILACPREPGSPTARRVLPRSVTAVRQDFPVHINYQSQGMR